MGSEFIIREVTNNGTDSKGRYFTTITTLRSFDGNSNISNEFQGILGNYGMSANAYYFGYSDKIFKVLDNLKDALEAVREEIKTGDLTLKYGWESIESFTEHQEKRRKRLEEEVNDLENFIKTDEIEREDYDREFYFILCY